MPKRNMVENPNVKCPYYKYERSGMIYCEGAEGNCNVHLAFGETARRKAYEKQFCQDAWGGCLIADAHNRKWGYEM